MQTSLALVGYDKEIAYLCRELGCYLQGYFAKESTAGEAAKHFGGEEKWDAVRSEWPQLRLLMGLDPGPLKRKLASYYGIENFASLRAPSAFVADSVKQGRGCLIQRNTEIGPDVVLGDLCKVNSGAAIHHDSILGNFCSVAPGARLLGWVELEDEVFVGAGAIILPRVRIGRGAVIGAGAVVTKAVEPGAKVVGVPAAPLRRS